MAKVSLFLSAFLYEKFRYKRFVVAILAIISLYFCTVLVDQLGSAKVYTIYEKGVSLKIAKEQGHENDTSTIIIARKLRLGMPNLVQYCG